MRALRARCRLALTGTPVENRSAISGPSSPSPTPGLLGHRRASSPPSSRAWRRARTTPTGRCARWCGPTSCAGSRPRSRSSPTCPTRPRSRRSAASSRKQAALYQQAVRGPGARARRAARAWPAGAWCWRTSPASSRFCNHPSHWLRDGRWEPERQRQAAAAGRAARRDRRPAGEGAGVHAVQGGDRSRWPPTSAARFGRPGLVLSGETAVGRRQKLVEQFQAEDGPPFFVLSLRAGRHRPQPDRRQPRHPLRPLVEPRGRGPGHRPRLPHRPEAQRAGPQADLPRHPRGAHRRAHREQARAGPPGGRGRTAATPAHRAVQRGDPAAGVARRAQPPRAEGS